MLMVSCHVAFAGTEDVLRTIAELNAAYSNGVAGLRYDVTAKEVEKQVTDEKGKTHKEKKEPLEAILPVEEEKTERI